MRRRGFTLVELLVVIAIVGLLVSLLLPAVQARAKPGVRADCRNKIRQLALAFQSHHEVHGHFAGDGWGLRRDGDPDRGTGWRQPGGWLYRLLPFTEARAVADLGRDGQPDLITPTQKAGLALATQQHLGWFNCPTRRPGRLVPLQSQWKYINMESGSLTATISYDANWGDAPVDFQGGHTTTRLETVIRNLRFLPEANGIVYPRSEVRAAQVTDGLSNTYLVGDTFWWVTDDSGDPDGGGLPTPLSSYVVNSGHDRPLRDMPPGPSIEREYERWGSSHPTTWNVAYRDGTAHAIVYDVDLAVHRRRANRQDGLVVNGLE